MPPVRPPAHDLGELERLLAEATPGPWEFSDSTDSRGHKGEFRAPDPYNGFMLVGPWTNSHDAILIAAGINALPDLLAAAKAAEHVSKRGILGKQSRLRLRAALRPFYGGGASG